MFDGNKYIDKIYVPILGEHIVYDSLGAISFAIQNGVPIKIIKDALKNFNGVKRRNEKIGCIDNVNFICDYAHHPTELIKNIDADKVNNSLVVFQPHTYSRTSMLIDDFIYALKKVDKLIIYKTYSARERYSKSGSAKTLYKRI